MGCFWGERNNNSYVSDNGNTYLGSGYYWSDVFEEYTTADARMECGSVPNNGRGCYIGCTCKSGWDGKKTYGTAASGLNQTGTVNATSAPGNYSATAASASAVVASSSASGINSGISAMAAGGSCTISLTDPRYGTTCSKSGTFACPSGYGYSLDSCKKNQETKYQVCSVDSTQTNSTLCYSAGTAKTCSDENPGYVSQCPSGQSGTKVTTSCNTCYKDCKKKEDYFDVTITVNGPSSVVANGCSYIVNLWSGEFTASVGSTTICSGSANQDWNVSCSGKVAASQIGKTVIVSASHVEWYTSGVTGGPSCNISVIPGPTASGSTTLSKGNGNHIVLR